MGRGIRSGLIAALAVAAMAGAQAAAGDGLALGNLGDGLAAMLLRPTAAPPGANDWSCRPTQAHPYPVILVHGTLANAAFTWQALSPLLANAGYCVFALNYGANEGSVGASSASPTSRPPPANWPPSSSGCAPRPGPPRSIWWATPRAA